MPEQMVSDRKEGLPETVVTMGENSTMQENEIDLLELGREVMANRRVLLTFALVPAVLTVITVLLMKPTYTAQASFLPPNSMSTGSSSFLSQLGALGVAGGALSSLKDPTLLYVGMLNSRTVADDLIRQFDLAKEYETKKLSQTEKALERHSEFISGKDTIITVSVQDHDPKRAADLANAYLAALHGLNDRIALTEAGQRRLFFEQQLEKQKNRLADAEVELMRSQNQTGLIQPTGQARLQLETIAQTQAEIASREIELAAGTGLSCRDIAGFCDPVHGRDDPYLQAACRERRNARLPSWRGLSGCDFPHFRRSTPAWVVDSRSPLHWHGRRALPGQLGLANRYSLSRFWGG